MTRGLAITSMLVLHLFCCLGPDVKGTPLIWLNTNKPLVYWFGFFAEICVPLYTLCAGYARELSLENGKDDIRTNGSRILKLLRNYWIVLGVFSILGLITGRGEYIPESPVKFFKSIVLLYSYNGAWWYLNTYILLLLIPTKVILYPIRRMNLVQGLFAALALDFVWYLLGHFGLVPDIVSGNAMLQFIYKEIRNIIDVLPYYWIGIILCKYHGFERTNDRLSRYIPTKRRKCFLLGLFAVVFIFVNLINKAVLIGPVAVLIFLGFNLMPKGGTSERVFLFLGKHSTNVWLTHMFFYGKMFEGLAIKAKYPMLIFLFLLLLCIAASYVIICVDLGITKIRKVIRKQP